jgi:hypothetical protein
LVLLVQLPGEAFVSVSLLVLFLVELQEALLLELLGCV